MRRRDFLFSTAAGTLLTESNASAQGEIVPRAGLQPSSSSTAQAGGASGVRRITPVYVTDFGADPSGARDSGQAIMAAKKHAQTHQRELRFPSGTYKTSTTLDLGWFEGSVIAEGSVSIVAENAAVSPVVMVDGTGEASLSYRMEGLAIFGAGGPSQIGLRTVRSHLSVFRNIMVRNVGAIGFKIEGDVLSQYDSCHVAQRGHPSSVPRIGFELSGTANVWATTACLFTNCVVEIASHRGWALQKATDCNWYGGSTEGLIGLGIEIAQESKGNSFWNHFMEHNSERGDLQLRGDNNSFYDCVMWSRATAAPYHRVKSIVVERSATGNRFEGGQAFAIEIRAGARNTSIKHLDPISYQIDDAGEGTVIEDCRQINRTATRSPARYAGNTESEDPRAWDWYEQGSFQTCHLGGSISDGSQRFVSRVDWTRSGNIVHFNCELSISAAASWPKGVLYVRLPDLPHTPARRTAVTIGDLQGLRHPPRCSEFKAHLLEGEKTICFWGITGPAGAPQDGLESILLTEAEISGNLPLRLLLSGSYHVGNT